MKGGINGKQADLLSSQEWRVIRLAAEGQIDKEIAEVMGVSLTTVRTYWERVREKLGGVNRTHCVCLALFRDTRFDEQPTPLSQTEVDVPRTLDEIKRAL
jgi:DNA-binding NarL/FixJ family response regulator